MQQEALNVKSLLVESEFYISRFVFFSCLAARFSFRLAAGFFLASFFEPLSLLAMMTPSETFPVGNEKDTAEEYPGHGHFDKRISLNRERFRWPLKKDFAASFTHSLEDLDESWKALIDRLNGMKWDNGNMPDPSIR